MPSSHAPSMSFISVFAVLSGKSKLEPRHPLFPLPTVKTDWSMLLLCSYGMAWNQRSLSVPKHAHPRIGFIFCKCFNYSIRMLLSSFSFLVNQFPLISPTANVQIRLRVSQRLHTSSQVVVGAIVGSVFCILWYTTWNSLLLEAFESSLLLQTSVFLVAAALTLAFATHVVLNWFRNDK